jgi:hypothetical protein
MRAGQRVAPKSSAKEPHLIEDDLAEPSQEIDAALLGRKEKRCKIIDSQDTQVRGLNCFFVMEAFKRFSRNCKVLSILLTLFTGLSCSREFSLGGQECHLLGSKNRSTMPKAAGAASNQNALLTALYGKFIKKWVGQTLIDH